MCFAACQGSPGLSNHCGAHSQASSGVRGWPKLRNEGQACLQQVQVRGRLGVYTLFSACLDTGPQSTEAVKNVGSNVADAMMMY